MKRLITLFVAGVLAIAGAAPAFAQSPVWTTLSPSCGVARALLQIVPTSDDTPSSKYHITIVKNGRDVVADFDYTGTARFGAFSTTKQATYVATVVTRNSAGSVTNVRTSSIILRPVSCVRSRYR